MHFICGAGRKQEKEINGDVEELYLLNGRGVILIEREQEEYSQIIILPIISAWGLDNICD